MTVPSTSLVAGPECGFAYRVQVVRKDNGAIATAEGAVSILPKDPPSVSSVMDTVDPVLLGSTTMIEISGSNFGASRSCGGGKVNLLDSSGQQLTAFPNAGNRDGKIVLWNNSQIKIWVYASAISQVPAKDLNYRAVVTDLLGRSSNNNAGNQITILPKTPSITQTEIPASHTLTPSETMEVTIRGNSLGTSETGQLLFYQGTSDGGCTSIPILDADHCLRTWDDSAIAFGFPMSDRTPGMYDVCVQVQRTTFGYVQTSGKSHMKFEVVQGPILNTADVVSLERSANQNALAYSTYVRLYGQYLKPEGSAQHSLMIASLDSGICDDDEDNSEVVMRTDPGVIYWDNNTVEFILAGGYQPNNPTLCVRLNWVAGNLTPRYFFSNTKIIRFDVETHMVLNSQRDLATADKHVYTVAGYNKFLVNLNEGSQSSPDWHEYYPTTDAMTSGNTNNLCDGAWAYLAADTNHRQEIRNELYRDGYNAISLSAISIPDPNGNCPDTAISPYGIASNGTIKFTPGNVPVNIREEWQDALDELISDGFKPIIGLFPPNRGNWMKDHQFQFENFLDDMIDLVGNRPVLWVMGMEMDEYGWFKERAHQLRRYLQNSSRASQPVAIHLSGIASEERATQEQQCGDFFDQYQGWKADFDYVMLQFTSKWADGVFSTDDEFQECAFQVMRSDRPYVAAEYNQDTDDWDIAGYDSEREQSREIGRIIATDAYDASAPYVAGIGQGIRLDGYR